MIDGRRLRGIRVHSKGDAPEHGLVVDDDDPELLAGDLELGVAGRLEVVQVGQIACILLRGTLVGVAIAIDGGRVSRGYDPVISWGEQWYRGRPVAPRDE